MTIIVEDGTMPDGANAYASLEDADAYCIDRGLWGDSGGDDVVISKKETALIRAADWLNGMNWKGEPVDPLRVMSWPRSNVRIETLVIDSDIVPKAVSIASIEAAALIFNGIDPLEPQLHGGSVVSTSESVGPISTSVTYNQNASTSTLYRSVTDRIKFLLNSVDGESGGFRVVKVMKG